MHFGGFASPRDPRRYGPTRVGSFKIKASQFSYFCDLSLLKVLSGTPLITLLLTVGRSRASLGQSLASQCVPRASEKQPQAAITSEVLFLSSIESLLILYSSRLMIHDASAVIFDKRSIDKCLEPKCQMHFAQVS